MFFALGRLILVMLVVSSIVYVSLWFTLRAAQTERLERDWEDEGRPGSRDEFIREGLDRRALVTRRRLLLGVYVVPIFLVTLLVYLTNYT
jgi:hypothetical protein